MHWAYFTHYPPGEGKTGRGRRSNGEYSLVVNSQPVAWVGDQIRSGYWFLIEIPSLGIGPFTGESPSVKEAKLQAERIIRRLL